MFKMTTHCLPPPRLHVRESAPGRPPSILMNGIVNGIVDLNECVSYVQCVYVCILSATLGSFMPCSSAVIAPRSVSSKAALNFQ